MVMDRPSHKEINRKIKQAREAISDSQFSILNPVSVSADVLKLGFTIEGISNILANLLSEITPVDYAGAYPPQKSYESDILDCELFTFRWASKNLGGEIYLKFAFKGQKMWVVSLHEERKKGESR
ncbi:MAG: hypothetical protein A2V86_09600 [Deltaproteobacteria bacterium RBG_16_49_23]|nr:MAG: hypothetical protein A2V86_09600 [Deltaproteobacteria bacterium RBG_16_49_23]